MDEIKPTLILEDDLFYEDEICDTKAIISKYFNIELFKYGTVEAPTLMGKDFRTSLNLARRMKFDTKPFDCTSWVPFLRKYMISPSYTFFNELGFIKNYISEFDFPLFVRPSNGHKTFSGQVFKTKDKFIEECNFLKQQNIHDDLLCMYSTNPRKLGSEYRCVYINHWFTDMSKYMTNGEKDVAHEYNEEARVFADKIANVLIDIGYASIISNFVIDVAKVENEYKLIEINCFETASFYACDLNKIYSEWQKHIIEWNRISKL